ncbi:hypothetical protein [Helicobacter cinaedi]|uniref:hypothetical protein n=1 Tax=Helicobacter cinaedi TaxID=213 RepID=UPI0015F0B924|nr:hypothetical protein [Helicobacter cinaedi]
MFGFILYPEFWQFLLLFISHFLFASLLLSLTFTCAGYAPPFEYGVSVGDIKKD